MTAQYEETDKFCTRSRLDRAIHTLEGILRGVVADGIICDEEKNAISQWVEENSNWTMRHPFNEIIPALDAIFSKESQTETIEDVLWLCDQMNKVNIYYDSDTADMQTLQGIVNGIMADDKIVISELKYLQKWIREHDNLKGLWPYDEIEALAVDVLKEGVIDDEEHERLIYFFTDFQRYLNDSKGDIIGENRSVQGICAVKPEITFSNRTFCVTGKSTRASRKEFEGKIRSLGGKIANHVNSSVDYIIIGSDGSSCWSYSCYGRKIETAMKLRKEGSRVIIVHEYDFWRCVEGQPV